MKTNSASSTIFTWILLIPVTIAQHSTQLKFDSAGAYDDLREFANKNVTITGTNNKTVDLNGDPNLQIQVIDLPANTHRLTIYSIRLVQN